MHWYFDEVSIFLKSVHSIIYYIIKMIPNKCTKLPYTITCTFGKIEIFTKLDTLASISYTWYTRM